MPINKVTIPAAVQANRTHQLLYTLATAYLQREQYAEAYDKLKQLLRLEADSPEILMETAMTGLRVGDVSMEALELYQQAVKHNVGYDAFEQDLSGLLIRHNIVTPFAVEVCERVANSAPAEEAQIRLYLKRYYEAAGLVERAREEEQKALFASRDGQAIRAHLEKLWWAGNFSEAEKALRSIAPLNGVSLPFTRELALTYAYQHLAGAPAGTNPEAGKIIRSALTHLVPSASPADLSDYLVLRAGLPAEDLPADEEEAIEAEIQLLEEGVEISEVAVASVENGRSLELLRQPFDLHREVLDVLARPENGPEEKNGLLAPCEGVLVAQITSQRGGEAPEKVLSLLSSYLVQLPNSVLRLCGSTFLSVAKDPQVQIKAMIDLLQSLEDYNAVAPEAERVFLLGALQSAAVFPQPEPRAALLALIEALHLLRQARRNPTTEAESGTLLLRAGEKEAERLKVEGINLIHTGGVRLLPGREITCAEVIWNNTLAQFKEGQVYEVGRYSIHKRLLKHSGYGTYLATDLTLDRPVVMKIILSREAANLQQEAAFAGRMREQLRGLARLSHPCLAFLCDLGEHEGMLYYAREFVEGKSLAEPDFRAGLRENEIHLLLQKMVASLQYAHARGVLHLNLKPGNLWVSAAGELKITDFRIPGFVDDAATANVLFPAHWRYAAPEMLLGQAGDSRSDIYSIGIIAYELLSGRHPYTTTRAINSPQDIFRARITPLSEVENPPQRAWNDLVMRAIQRDVEKRFQSLDEMQARLGEVM